MDRREFMEAAAALFASGKLPTFELPAAPDISTWEMTYAEPSAVIRICHTMHWKTWENGTAKPPDYIGKSRECKCALPDGPFEYLD